MKTMLYCQHSIGIGHLMRTLRLAKASLPNGPVRLICGGEIPKKLNIDRLIEIDALPPLRMAPDSSLVDPFSSNSIDELFRQRREQAVAAVRDFQPDALIVEMFPFGRKKFADEILTIIEAARSVSKAKVFSSVRDVLVTKRRDQYRHDQRAVKWLNVYFDALLIHSDPNLITLNQTFSTFELITIPVYYTGYISGTDPAAVAEKKLQVIVSAGGGRVGRRLIDTAAKACPEIRQKLGLDMLIIKGPLGKDRALSNDREQAPKTATFINDLPDVLARSSLSISQCGYNTATDILRARIPAVFVPFETESEDEQLRRAELLSGRGRAITLRENALTPESLLEAACQAQALMNQENCASTIDLGGAQRSRTIVKELSCDA